MGSNRRPLESRRFVSLTLAAATAAHAYYVFKTRREVERYFGGKTIECLLCGQRFRRLADTWPRSTK